MVDSALLAAKIAAVRDATARVRAVLPSSADVFAALARFARFVTWARCLPAAASCMVNVWHA